MAGVSVSVLGPPDVALAGGDPNENSLVVQLRHGATSFLFTGDAEQAGERFLVEEYGDTLRTTVLRAGHHGSATSTGDALLSVTQPRAAVLSAPYNSQYGHPHEETLRRLADRAVPSYWTTTHGSSVFASNGTHVTAQSQQSAPTDPLRLRRGHPIAPGNASGVVTRRVIAADGTGRSDPTQPDRAQLATALTLAAVATDAAGASDDRENLTAEFVTFENTADELVDLSGWTVSDAAGATYRIPNGTTIAPGAQVTLHTGSGKDTTTDLYWGLGRPVWNNDGDTVTVRTATGLRVLTTTYP